jgi:hypothetical protein
MRYPLLLVCFLLPAACAPEARWPQETSLQIASPADTVVTSAIATAVDWWMAREPMALSAGPVGVYLAPSLDPAKASLVKLLPSCDLVDADGGSAVAVRAVRMHNASAQIDLDAPRPGHGRQLITIDMRKFALTPWEVTGANWWRFSDKQLERITSDAVAASQEVPVGESSTATAQPNAE